MALGEVSVPFVTSPMADFPELFTAFAKVEQAKTETDGLL